MNRTTDLLLLAIGVVLVGLPALVLLDGASVPLSRVLLGAAFALPLLGFAGLAHARRPRPVPVRVRVTPPRR